ncbi:MAG: histidinol-phosphatase HisJ [Candidatus Hodarchaeales archaeon]
MKLWDYHTHHERCNHATGKLKNYIAHAIQLDLEEIGLSDHFPMTFLPEVLHIYSMSLEEFPNYIAECKQLKEKYKDKITIKIASEVDYYPGTFVKYKEAIKPHLEDMDYTIGSVHAINSNRYETIPVDTSLALPLIEEMGVDAMYFNYYDSLDKMVRTGFYDIVGHLDLPKKYGLRAVSQDIWEVILNLLDMVSSKGMTVEINTSGIRNHVKEHYPSEDIIKELLLRDIPIVLGSDAHKPEHIAYAFPDILKKLKKLGCKNLAKYSKREITKVPIV